MHLYNSTQSEKGLESYYLRLSGQAAQCGWSVATEKEVVRDLFIGKMRLKDIQRELCIRPRNSSEETLKSTLLQGKGYVTTSILQIQMGSNSSSSNFPFKRGTTNKIVCLELKIAIEKKIPAIYQNQTLLFLRKGIFSKPNGIMSLEKLYLQILR